MNVLLRLVGSAWCVLVALVCLASTARADEPRRSGKVHLETPTGGNGPIALLKKGDVYEGELNIVNTAKTALVVSRIAIRGDASDPRTPSKVTTHLADGSVPVTIPPGGSRRAVVQWTPEKTGRLRQVFGHVVVTTSDEETGDVLMGFRGQAHGLLGPFSGHVLALLLGAPTLAAFVTILGRVLRRRDDRTPHLVTVAALGAQVLLAGWMYYRFVPDLSRADGNDGLQLIVHVVWLRSRGIELYLGLDGLGAMAILFVSVIAFFAVLSERTIPRGAAGYHTALLLLDAALVGVAASMDGVVFLFFAALAILASAVLVGAWGSTGGRRAARRILVPGIFAVVALGIALVTAAHHVEPSFLVDGTKSATTFSLPELARMAPYAKDVRLLGGGLAHVGFLLTFGASLFLLGGFPFHGWIGDVVAEAPPATGILAATALPTIGLCAFLRIGCAVFPDGMRWASGVVVALGAVTAGYGALSALGQTDLRRLAACATTSLGGFVLLGAGSLTPQGLSGAMVVGTTRVVAVGSFLLLANAVHDRVRTVDVARIGGIGRQMPGWGVALAATALAQAGVLGVGGAWGPLLALLGVLSTYAPLAIVAGVALVVLAVAHLAALTRIGFGKVDPAWQSSPILEPFGGKFTDLSGREWASVAPLVALVLILGLWPTPVVSITTGTVRDLANAVSPPGPDQVAAR